MRGLWRAAVRDAARAFVLTVVALDVSRAIFNVTRGSLATELVVGMVAALLSVGVSVIQAVTEPRQTPKPGSAPDA